MHTSQNRCPNTLRDAPQFAAIRRAELKPVVRRPFRSGRPGRWIVGFSAGGLLLGQVLQAQLNDTCAQAFQLSPGVLYSFNNANATSTGDPVPTCQANFGRGIWFTYRPTGDGLVSVSTCGSSFDTVVQVYRGTCAALTPVACNDDNGPACTGNAASLTFSGVAGTTYYILVGGFESRFGTLRISAGLVNDHCSGAITLPYPCTNYRMNTGDATTAGDPGFGEPTCQTNFGKGVWFTFRLPASGTYTLSTCGSSFDTVIQLYEGECDPEFRVRVACNDDNGPACGGNQASVSFNGRTNFAYRVLIGGFNSTSGDLVVTWDAVSPTITCPPDQTVQCADDVPARPTTLSQFVAQGGSARDNCDTSLSYRSTDDPVGSGCAFTLIRVHTVTDDAGRSASCTQRFTIRDTIPPTITCPPNFTQCESQVPAPPRTLAQFLAQGGRASDNCDTNLAYSVSDGPLTGGSCGGFFRRTHTVRDDCTNAASCVQIITVNDTAPPILSCPTNPIVVECTGSNSAFVTYLVVASDVCGLRDLDCQPPSGSRFSLGPRTVSCTATDLCTNRSTCQFSVTVRDTTPPVITCANDRTVECGATWTFSNPTATDVCNGTAVIIVVSTVTNSTCNGAFVAIRTWRATDPSGNSSTCSQRVTVVDTTPPVLTCGRDRIVECGTPWTFDLPTVSDVCSGTAVNLQIISTVTNFVIRPCPNLWFATRTWRATDPCGNVAECSQTVTVRDTTPPVLTCANNKTVECGSDWTFDPPRAEDACYGADVTLQIVSTVTNVSTACPTVWVVIRTWRATDRCTNSSACSQTVTVVDTTPPVLTCANNRTVECGSSWTFTPPTAVDACNGTNVTLQIMSTVTNLPIAPCPTVWVVIRTWRATDRCNNSFTCSQTVSVVDTTPPVLTCASPKTVECGSAWTYDPPSAVDACSGTEVTIQIVNTVTNVSTAQCPVRWTATRIWQATDRCTNRSTCSQTVTVRDTIPPTIRCPVNVSVQCLSDVPPRPANLAQFLAAGGQASDNCDPSLAYSASDGSLAGGPCGGTIRRVHTVSDACSNSAVCIQTFTVRDTLPPVITCPNNLVVCPGTPVFFTATARDNCDTAVALVCQPPSGQVFPIGVHTVACTATDDCTNSARCTFTVTVLEKCEEIDHFPDTAAVLELCTSTSSETVIVRGPTTVVVDIDPQGHASDSDGDGKDQVTARMTQLDLSGQSALGAVSVRLNPNQASRGWIEEQQNPTPGILDVRPFAQGGLADSCFDLFVEIRVQTAAGVIVLRNKQPKQMCSVIDYKPPGPGTIYQSPERIQLYFENDQPSPYSLCATRHLPVVEVDHFENTTAVIELCTTNTTETVTLQGPTTVAVDIGPAGQTSLTSSGKDRVLTHMLVFNLSGVGSMGPVQVRLNPLQPSNGDIIEQVNNTPGILDIRPFRPNGLADSCFNMFVEIVVQTPNGPLVLHNRDPKRMCTVIDHKPPGPGATYQNPDRIPLYLPNGQFSGYWMCATRHTPAPSPVEIDTFAFSLGELELVMPSGAKEIVAVSGDTTVAVFFEGATEGTANDDDNNQRDDVRTRMLELNLSGMSSNLGPIHVTLNPNLPSWGGMEEVTNPTPGVMDIAPFTLTGSADSFFNLYFKVQAGGQVFYTVVPKRMSGRITHKPPGPLDWYENLEDIPLVTASGQPTGYFLGAARHRPQPPVEIDEFDFSLGELELVMPGGINEVVAVSGKTTVAVFFEGATEGSANDDNNNQRDDVRTRMIELNLSGLSPRVGPIAVRLNPNLPSWGGIEEVNNPKPGTLDLDPFTPGGTADSFFDLFFEVTVAGQTFYTVVPKRMSGRITHKPPGPLDWYENLEDIPLVTASGQPTGYFLGASRHRPQPPVEIDEFDFSLGELELVMPGGVNEVVAVSGKTTVAVFFEGATEGSANDDNNNQRDDVRTRMIELNLSGLSPRLGSIAVRLNPNLPSWGGIEEVNNPKPGTLDLDPFTPGGTADSFFNLFFEVTVGGQTFYTVVPKRMSGRITHKPPGPLDWYENLEDIPLVTADGQPTGYFLGSSRHRPQPPVEIDTFDFSIGALELRMPDGTRQTVAVSGSNTVAVFFEGATEGSANDSDGDGLDDVQTRMVALHLVGLSPTLGVIRVGLNPNMPSWGGMEEVANSTPGVMDLPPFTLTGSADSFFNLFFRVEVAGQTFYTVVPKRMSGRITHKPPGPLDWYENVQDIPLVTADGQPTGYFLSAARHRPEPPVEIDTFAFSIGALELRMPDGTSQTVPVSGSNTVAVYFEGATEGSANDSDGDGLDDVQTRMVALNLAGLSPTLGPIFVGLHPTLPSWGGMEETANNTPGVLDIQPFTPAGSANSFFDLFFEVRVAGQTFYTAVPKHMSGRITHKPPGPLDWYENLEDIPLVTANGLPTGYFLSAARHRPQPPVEIDKFEFSLGELELVMPNGATETVAVSGPTTVAVYFEGATEGTANDDNNNQRDDVRTQMIDLNLSGQSPQFGPIVVSLNPTLPSWGWIEEVANPTPGVLDIAPFAPGGGSADSHFDLFFQVQVAGRTLYTVQPKRMSSRITHKPPGPGELYENVERIPLVTSYGFPTGFYLGATRHIPTRGCPKLEISRTRTGLVLVCWRDSGADCVLESTRSVSPPAWHAVTLPVVVLPDGRKCVQIEVGRGMDFYRMAAPR